MSHRAAQWLIAGMLACLLITAVMDFGALLGISGDTNAVLTLLAGVVFVILHGRLALGWKRLAVFAGVTVAVSFTAEAVGVATGWVFGPYHYTDNLGFKILGVPPLVQAGYVAMSYASLTIARVILGKLGPLRGWSFAAVALAGALVMVSWDVAMDPYQSTVSGDWIWHDGGPYFGVPLHNYAGWFGTVIVFLLIYLAYERAHPLPEPAGATACRWFWALPVFYYALLGLSIVIVPLVGGVSLPFASPQNYSGSLDVLEQSLTLVAIFVMGPPVVLALARLGLDRPPAASQP